MCYLDTLFLGNDGTTHGCGQVVYHKDYVCRILRQFLFKGYHDSGCQTRWITAFHSQIYIRSFHVEIRKERSIQTRIVFPSCINQSVRDTFTQRPCGFNSACNGSYLHKIGACPRNNCYFHIVST